MTSISRTLSALAAGALLASVAGAAQAQTPYSGYSSPARDIPGSCRNVEQLADGYVSAECQAEGGWRWSALRPVDCRSSISNRDGTLTCTGARATLGALYPDNDGDSGQATTQQPGGIIGALAGYFGGWLDALLSRITDVFFAVPLLLAAIVFMQMFKAREPYTEGARSQKWAAMVVGESSRLLYGLPGKPQIVL